MAFRSFAKVPNSDQFVFRVGRRVVAVQQFDATADDIMASIGVAIELKTYGASILGTREQLLRFAKILDVTNTLDCCDAEYRRASIAAARRLLAALESR